MGGQQLAALGQGFVAHLLAQLDHRIEDRLRARRAAGEIEIHRDQFVHAPHSGGGIGREHTASDRAGPHGDHILGLRHLLIEPHQGGSHLHGHGAGHDQQVCLARAGTGHQAEAVEVEAGADQGGEFDEAAGGAIEQRPEAAEPGPVVQVIEAGEDHVLGEIRGDRGGAHGGATGGPKVTQASHREAFGAGALGEGGVGGGGESHGSGRVSSTRGRLCARRRPGQ